MEGSKENRSVNWEKLLTVLYYLMIGLVSAYMAVRARSWGNLLLGVETGWVFGALAAGYFWISCAASKDYLVGENRPLTYLYGVSTFWFIYLSMAIVTLDLAQWILGFFLHDPILKEKLFLGAGFLAIFFVIVMNVIGTIQVKRIKVVHYPIALPGLSRKYRMVLLSDLHIGYYVCRRHIESVVRSVNALEPDLIAVSGDTINAGNTRECPEIDAVAEELTKLSAKEGVFAVTGNHDPDGQDPEFVQFLKDAHFTLLDEKVYTNDCLHLIGRRTCTKARKPLNELEHGLSKDRPVIVIDHDPIGTREAIREKADLVLCGHTHKGQVFPLDLFCRVLYSKSEFWGCSKTDSTNVVVSAGAGYFSMPMRVGSSCEVVCLDLTPQ